MLNSSLRNVATTNPGGHIRVGYVMNHFHFSGNINITEIDVCDGRGITTKIVLKEPITIKPTDSLAVQYDEMTRKVVLCINGEPHETI